MSSGKLRGLLVSALFVGCAAQTALGAFLSTAAPNNGLTASGGGVMFDLTASSTFLNVTSFDYFASSVAGTATSVDVYMKSGTHAGFESTPAAWTFLGNAAGVSAGTTTAAPLNTPDISIAPGATIGVYLIAQAGGIRYTGTGGAVQQTFSNADITLFGGIARSTPWGGSNFNPRVFAGTVNYDLVPEPAGIGLLAVGLTVMGARARRR